MSAKGAVIALLAVALSPGAGASMAAGAEARGQQVFTFRYEAPTSPGFQALSRTLREARVLEGWTEHVGTSLNAFPIRMDVSFTECEAAGSWYDPSATAIIVCYEEVHRAYVTLMAVGHQDEKLALAWIGTIFGQLYHELAHGLMHELMLPIAGREEDAADSFSVLALLNHPRGQDLVLGGADYLQEMTRIEKESGYDLSQRHPLYGQRYFNMLCLTYGSDPGEHQTMVDSGRLPAARAKTCRLEYLRALHAWDTLLRLPAE